MAPTLSASGAYTVVIIPLKSSLRSPDALRFYQWIKHLKDLEKEKDALWSGLEVLEKARLWYLQRLSENRTRQDPTGPAVRQNHAAEARSCLLRSHIQRANGCLGSVMAEPSASSNPPLSDAAADSALRWRNTVLTQKISSRNRQISLLELQNEVLLDQLEDLQRLETSP